MLHSEAPNYRCYAGAQPSPTTVTTKELLSPSFFLTTVTPEDSFHPQPSRSSDLLSSCAYDPAWSSPPLTTTPSQSGTHPKASRLELTGGKGGVAAAVGEHSRGGGVMVSCPSRFSLDLSHCAKPNLPGTKMVGRKLWRKRISSPDVIWVRGRTEQPGCVCRLSNGKVSLSQG